MMKKWGLYSVLILILGLVIACPSADPVDEPEQKEEKQEVVTLDAGVPDGTSPEEDAGSVVPPEASDAGTPHSRPFRCRFKRAPGPVVARCRIDIRLHD